MPAGHDGWEGFGVLFVRFAAEPEPARKAGNSKVLTKKFSF